jgi:hypothetical protein
MEYDTRTYFEENGADDVKGFTIIGQDADTEEYHIAEKWVRDSAEDTWVDYYIPEAQLLSRVRDGDCKAKATLSEEQYETVCDKAGWRETYIESAVGS